MNSIYSTFANHNADLINARRVSRHAEGDGMAWGQESHTPAEAAADMGAIVVCEYADGAVIAELSDRLFWVGDVGGSWAVEVATQEDLSDADIQSACDTLRIARPAKLTSTDTLVTLRRTGLQLVSRGK